MNQQQTATVNLQNISWTINDLTVDVPSSASDTLNYETKTEMQIKNDLSAIALTLHINVTDAKKTHPKALAILSLTMSAQVSGLQAFVSGTTANIPNEFAHQLVITMSHTARGILMQAGRGTALEKYPLPLFGAEQIGQAQVMPQQRVN